MEADSRRQRERDQREAAIVAAARQVFLQKGYGDSSMDEIARLAEFTKPTLYQYFKDKESLYLAVALTGLRQLRDALETGVDPQAGAWQTITATCRRLLEFCAANPEVFRLVGALNQIRPRESRDGGADRPERVALAGFNDRLFADMEALIGRAQREGSIAPGLDARSAAFSLLFVLTGFLNQLSVTGQTFAGHFGLDRERFAGESLDFILRGLNPLHGAGAAQGARP
jgi:AcrR family transcriptional regulator